MSIAVRPYKGSNEAPKPGEWEYDIKLTLPDGTHHRERKKADTRTETQTKLFAEKRLSFLMANGLPAAPEPTLEEFWPKFLAYCKGNRRKPATIRHYTKTYERYLKTFDGLRLGELSPVEIAALKSNMAHLGAGTVNGALRTLHRILKVALELDLLEKIPRFSYLPEAPKEIVPYSDEEQARLLNACQRPYERAFILLAFDTGLRASEMAALRREDLDLVAGYLLVKNNLSEGIETTPKSKKSERQIYLTSRLKTAIEAQLKTHAAPRVLFVGGVLDRSAVARWLSSLERRAGLPNRHAMSPVHRTRHTFATRLAAKGATAKEIAELLGHSTLAQAERYIHLAAKDRPRAIALLEAS